VTNSESGIFVQLVSAILDRYRRQNAMEPLAEEEKAMLAARLWTLITVRGLPPPLAKNEMGAPGEMSAEEVAPLVAVVIGEAKNAETLKTPVRQLVKACFHPEFKKCRDSFRELDANGTCRRQQLGRARERVSGAHCVDCPHWVALAAEQHRRFLAKAWHGDASEFTANQDVFLPEDFRALRRWLYAARRKAD